MTLVFDSLSALATTPIATQELPEVRAEQVYNLDRSGMVGAASAAPMNGMEKVLGFLSRSDFRLYLEAE